MIKFFRKIRRQLVTQNKFTKYLLYAIGEIILVVIGILIALQINNNNENHIIKQTEIKILKELKLDFESNYIEIENIRNRLHIKSKNTAEIISIIKHKKNIEQKFELLDSLGGIMGFLGGEGGIFNSANTSYKNIENSGIKIIKNTELRISITEMYERHFKNITKREEMIRKFFISEYQPFITEYFELSSDSIGNANVSKVNLNSIKNVRIFNNLLIKKLKYQNFRLNQINIILEKLDELIKCIELEITHLEKSL